MVATRQLTDSTSLGAPNGVARQNDLVSSISRISTLEAGQAGSSFAYDTLALLNANLSPAAGIAAQVINDGANNGLYVKAGVSGSGSWVKKTSDTLPGLAAFRDLLQAGIKTLDPDEYEAWGPDQYLVLDRNFGLLEQGVSGVRRIKMPWAFDSGLEVSSLALQAATLAGQSIEYIDGDEYEAWGDARANMLLDANYGLLYPTQTQTVPATPTPTSLYAVHTGTDGAGRTQVYRHARGSGLVAQLSPAGSNNTAPRLTPDGDVIYTSDRANGAPSGLYYTPVSAADERPYFPLPFIVAAGDSMTASGYPELLGSSLGVTAYNFGKSADTSRSIASRLRAIDTPVAVTGNQIPASGSVSAVLLGPGNPVQTFGNTNASVTGTLAGVPGTFAYASGAYTFTRTTSGSTVSCPSGTLFLPDLIPSNTSGVAVPNIYDMVFIIWMGRNNVTDKITILSHYAAFVARMRPYVKRFLVSPVFNNTGEPRGNANYDLLIDLNASLEAAYPDNYPRLGGLDARQYIVSQYDPAQSQDVTDYNNDCTPTSLRNSGDGLHLNTAGNTKLATGFYKPVLQARGWF